MVRTLFLISIFACLAGVLIAQDDAAYKTAMQAVSKSAGGRGALRAAITAKDVAMAATEAKTVQAGFETIVAYWTAKKADDAIKFATAARDAAKAIADAKDADAQSAAWTTMNAQCGQCHTAHRGGMPPNFEIK